MEPHGTFDQELARLASDLRRLRLERGNPSYRQLAARAEKSLTGVQLPIATQSDAFLGKRLLGLDLLMGLVRILLAYDEDGRERPVPPHTAPALRPWRNRWRTLQAVRPPRARVRQEPRTATATAPPPAPAPAVPERPPAHPAAGRPTEAGPTPAPASVRSVRSVHPSGFTLTHLLTAGGEYVSGLAFSPDGLRLATGVGKGTVRLWDLREGHSIGVPDHGPADTLSLAFSPDGRTLATAHADRSVRLWDPATSKPLGPALRGHGMGVTAMAFSPDGRTLVTGDGDRAVHRWRVPDGRPAGAPLTGLRGAVRALRFLPDGRLVAALQSSVLVELWDLLADTDAGEPTLSGKIVAVAVSPDGRQLATAGEGAEARLWNTADGVRIGSALAWPARIVWDVAYSPDGNLVAAAGDYGELQLWDTRSGIPVGRPLTGHDRRLHHVAFSPDGRTLAACGEGDTVVVYSTAPSFGAPVLSPLAARALGGALYSGVPVSLPALASDSTTPLGRVAFSPDGSRLFAAGPAGPAVVWDPLSGRRVPQETPAAPADAPWGLAFPRDGRSAVLWNRSAGGGTPLHGLVSLHEGVAFSPDGRRAAVVEPDGRMRLWDVAGGSATDQGFAGAGPVTALAYSPDGGTVVLAVGRAVVRWNTATGEPRGRAAEDHRAAVRALAVTPDRRLVATGDASGLVCLRDVDGHWHPRQPSGHPGEIGDLAFAPGGALLAVASGAQVWLWDLVSMRPVGAPLGDHGSTVRGVAFSPDGGLLAASCADGLVRLWLTPLSVRDRRGGAAPASAPPVL
ncbi:WD40 repeat domain-containing protein [Streptomyces sp. NPDC006879]|uniref:WD40 repeat domain-containing protein n=1 Tax=Streptomyces sp. NPDC006879 TaxID=3364767 RepID=UPI00368B627A